MATLFEETVVNGLSLKNRLVRSATWEGMCEDDGRPTGRLADFYRRLARGSVGLIVSGYTFVRPEGKQLPGKMGIHDLDFAGDFENLTRAVHEEGGKIAIQLVHAGGQTDTPTAGRRPLAPSDVEVAQYPERPEALSETQVTEIVEAFAAGAARARSWGFDAVQLHGAHGYLINQFLSPLTNRRPDRYGGDVNNRCRFLCEVYDAVRRAVGADFPVLIKLNASDNLDGGLEIEDAVFAAKALAARGIDAIEVSSGTGASGENGPVRRKIDTREKEAYNLDAARRIKNAAGVPVIVVGGFRSYEVAEKAVAAGGVDYVAMARPFIREPGLARRWSSGDRSRAFCISCSGCFRPGLKEGGIYCVTERKERETNAQKLGKE